MGRASVSARRTTLLPGPFRPLRTPSTPVPPTRRARMPMAFSSFSMRLAVSNSFMLSSGWL